MCKKKLGCLAIKLLRTTVDIFNIILSIIKEEGARMD